MGQGGATLIIGPNGTRILYDFGNISGVRSIIPYLQSLNSTPDVGLDYAIVSHRDHYIGYKALIDAGYQIFVANYGSGSNKDSSLAKSSWLDMQKNPCGSCSTHTVRIENLSRKPCRLIVVAANGRVWHTASATE